MKRRTKLNVAVCCVLLAVVSSFAAGQRYEIGIPDIAGYKTLKCDFHMHTVFSDGAVWPTVRVDEAWRDGLDAIAITDHIEYQPHKNDIPTNYKRSYEIARGKARDRNILLVKAAEITRDTPPGHYNALFLDTIDALDTKGQSKAEGQAAKDEEFLLAIKAANEQKAFVFWDHPNWQARNGGRVWFDIHTRLFKEKLVHGIEVVNDGTFYTDSFKWCLERNLPIFGNSDVHGPLDPPTVNHENHRTMTLVFAREKTLEALRDAIVNGRTAVWFEDKLIGRKEYLEEIFAASVEVKEAHSKYRNNAYFEVHNKSEITYQLQKISGGGPSTVVLPAQRTVVLRAPISEEGAVDIAYKVTNLLIGPAECLKFETTIDIGG